MKTLKELLKDWTKDEAEAFKIKAQEWLIHHTIEIYKKDALRSYEEDQDALAKLYFIKKLMEELTE